MKLQGKIIHCHWNVGIWLLETIQGSQKKIQQLLQGKLSLQTFTCSWPIVRIIEERKMFGSFQCGIDVLENLKTISSKFRLIFMKTFYSMKDVGDRIKIFAKEGKKLSQLRKMFCSGLMFQNKTVLWSLLSFGCISNSVLFAQKYNAALTTFQKNCQEPKLVSSIRKKTWWQESCFRCRNSQIEASKC